MKTHSRFGTTIADQPLVTVNDSTSIDFTASGTSNQTITAALKVSATAGNIAALAGDGLMVNPITNVTYAELAALISGNLLKVGHKYKITNYQTVHTIPGTVDTNTGSTEALIVTAIATNDLAPIAYSTTYPNDIIYYSPSNDVLVIPGCTKGYIYRRIDTVNNIDICFDYKNVKFRRWDLNVTDTWDIGTSYDRNDVVEHNGVLYISSYNANLGNEPEDILCGYWAPFGYSNGQFVSHSAVQLEIGDSSAPIILPVDTYSDVYFFYNAVGAGVSDFYFSQSTANKISHNTIITHSPNRNVTIRGTGSSFENNTFGSLNDVQIDGNTVQNNLIFNIVKSKIQCSSFSDNIGYNIYINNANKISITENSIYNCAITFDTPSLGALTKNTIHLRSFIASIKNGFTSAIFGKYDTQLNDVHINGLTNSTDYSAATILYGAYTKRSFKNSAGTFKLEYIDGAGVLQIVAVTA